jgi:O-antigen/teichoic acid export membrane protein
MSQKLNNSFTEIFNGASLVFVGMIFSNILGLFNQILFGRLLGPQDYGLFNLGISIISIFSLFAILGLGSGLSQYLPYNIIQNNNSKALGAIKFALKCSFCIGLLIASILFSLAPYIANTVFNEPKLEGTLRILCLAFPFYALFNVAQGVLVGIKKIKYKVYNEDIFTKLIQIFLFIILWAIGYKYLAAFAAYTVATIFCAIYYVYIINKKIIPSLGRDHEERIARGELISLSWPLFLAGFTMIFMSNTDKILLGRYLEVNDIGIYTASLTIASLLYPIFSCFRIIFLPIMSEYSAVKDFQGINKIYSLSTKWIFFIMFPITLYFIIYSEIILSKIYGNQFISGGICLAILAIGFSMNSLTGMTGEILAAIKETKLNLVCELIGAFSNIGLNIILIPKFGIIGASIGTSISIVLRNAFSLGFVYQKTKIQPYNIDYIKVVLFSTSVMILMSYILKFYFDSSWLYIAIIPCFIVAYIIWLFNSKVVDETDKLILTRIKGKIISLLMSTTTNIV